MRNVVRFNYKDSEPDCTILGKFAGISKAKTSSKFGHTLTVHICIRLNFTSGILTVKALTSMLLVMPKVTVLHNEIMNLLLLKFAYFILHGSYKNNKVKAFEACDEA